MKTTISEKPILFSPEMVRSILSGTKTQTRREVKDVPSYVKEFGFTTFTPKGHITGRGIYKDQGQAEWHFKCPFGWIGDHLWVKETYYCDHCFAQDYKATRGTYVLKSVRDAMTDEQCQKEWRGEDNENMYYKADVISGRFQDAGYWAEPGSHWKPSIHMPRWASRINLEITNVRVERMQDGGDREFWGEQKWNENPWVWVYDFKVIKK